MKAKNCAIISALIACTYILIDYLNVPSKLGVGVECINLSAANTFFNVGALLLVFLLTYFLIDKHNEDARTNQKNIVKYMMESDYKACKKRLEMFQDEGIRDNIISKIDYDQTLDKNGVFYNLVSIAFRNSEAINDYAKQGIIDISYYKEYDKIRSDYEQYVTFMVLTKGDSSTFEGILPEAQNLLSTNIDAAIERLSE